MCIPLLGWWVDDHFKFSSSTFELDLHCFLLGSITLAMCTLVINSPGSDPAEPSSGDISQVLASLHLSNIRVMTDVYQSSDGFGNFVVELIWRVW